MFDLIIKGGKVLDGTGNPFYRSDIGIKDGKIASIAKNLEGAKKVIDANGLTVSPGFIDSHSHSDTQILTFPDQKEKVEQGITLSVGGMCGGSIVPRTKNSDATRSVGEFMSYVKDMKLGSSVAFFIGHGNIRDAVMGTSDKDPTEKELEEMKSILREAMENGAIGMSLGLIYNPGCYSKTAEIVALAKVVAEYNGLISSHLRDEGDNLVRSVDEFLEIIRASGVRGIISHHKAMKRDNFGKISQTLRMIKEANDEGYEVYCDVYPYTASYTSMSARFIPKEYRANGMMKENLADPEIRKAIYEYNKEAWGKAADDLSWVQICSCNGYPMYEGLTVTEAARIHGKEQFETVFDLIANSTHCECCFFMMCEEDLETVLKFERSMICTDSHVAGASKVFHPRTLGSFPRALGRYARDNGVTSIAEMVRKMTSLPASVYGFKKKGLILEGYDADICIFDDEKIIDRAEFNNCTRGAEGLAYVIIDGDVVAENAIFNGVRRGKVISKQG